MRQNNSLKEIFKKRKKLTAKCTLAHHSHKNSSPPIYILSKQQLKTENIFD